jgi:hypothetical protein
MWFAALIWPKTPEIFTVNKIIIPRVESRNAAIRGTVFSCTIIFLSLNGIVKSKDWFKGNSLDTQATRIQIRSHPMCKILTTEEKTQHATSSTYTFSFGL